MSIRMNRFRSILGLVIWFSVAGCGGGGRPAAAPKIDVDGVISQLESSDPMARCIAVTSLGHLGPEADKAIPQIESMREDPDERVRRAVKVTLEQLHRE